MDSFVSSLDQLAYFVVSWKRLLSDSLGECMQIPLDRCEPLPKLLALLRCQVKRVHAEQFTTRGILYTMPQQGGLRHSSPSCFALLTYLLTGRVVIRFVSKGRS